MRKFNTTGRCSPDRHYMADMRDRLRKIRELIEEGDYFVINRARQYGKTTFLSSLKDYLKDSYLVVFLNFQVLSEGDYRDEYTFSSAFADIFLDALEVKRGDRDMEEAVSLLREMGESVRENVGLRRLFKVLGRLCASAPVKMVLLVDEVDSASNNQVFLDFLAQLRAGYLNEDRRGTFWSVILAGVYDIRNLKRKMHPGEGQSYNSPWNIAADFDVDLSLGKRDIAGMLEAYEEDWHTGMDVAGMAELLYEYTAGYPFLVSRLCKIMDEVLPGKDGVFVRKEEAYSGKDGAHSEKEEVFARADEAYPKKRGFSDKALAWSRNGMVEAVKILLMESNTLFDDMVKKLHEHAELKAMLYAILFEGERVPYNIDNTLIHVGKMFGFVKNVDGNVAVSNRIFETRLYNLFMSEDAIRSVIYKETAEKKRYIENA